MVDFVTSGWKKFPADPALERWVHAVAAPALATLEAPEFAPWWRNQRTWFVGVNALPNDATGAVAGGPPLAGAAVDFARQLAGGQVDWDRAQISTITPGYPRQGDDSAAAFAFRRKRDAAHMDGLHLVDGRRYLLETPAFLLGIPLNSTGAGASPLVVWEGSHRIMGDMLRRALSGYDPGDWAAVDLTEAYKTARQTCFERCKRVAIHARPGEAYVLHRMALHGVSPWQAGAKSAPPGRMIAYFRPDIRPRSAFPGAAD